MESSFRTVNDQVGLIAIDGEKRIEFVKNLYSDQKFISNVKSYILSNGGKVEDYEDMLNDGILAFLKTVIKKDIVIKADLKSYIFGIIRNLWLSKLRRNGLTEKVSLKASWGFDVVDAFTVENVLIADEKKDVLNKVIEMLSPICQKVLTLWALNYSMKEIAKNENLVSEGAVRKRKYDCMKNLNNILKENPSLKSQLR